MPRWLTSVHDHGFVRKHWPCSSIWWGKHLIMHLSRTKTGRRQDGWVIETDVLGCLFYCPKMCGRKYKSKRAVKLHMKYECGVKPQFQYYNLLNCLRCGRKYKHKSTLKAHLRYECGVAPKFQCSICNKMFKHKSHLKNHVISVHKIFI
eukprot:XP_008186080.1 PREDICTED: zinc finger protein 33A-like isoform X2 [Acyrthosiphon pisum]